MLVEVLRDTLQARRPRPWLRLQHMVWGIEAVSCALTGLPGPAIPGVLRAYGARVGRGVNCKPGLVIDNASGDQDSTGDFSNLSIGDLCYIGRGVFLDLPDRVTIGRDCAIASGVRIITHAEVGRRPLARWYPRHRAPVEIGAGCGIGVGATILAGVTLGPLSVVAGGAVVTQSFPERSVVAGMPARLVRTLDYEEAPGRAARRAS